MYQVKNLDGSWTTVKAGVEMLVNFPVPKLAHSTWLRYLTDNGCYGIASPAHWRVAPRGN